MSKVVPFGFSYHWSASSYSWLSQTTRTNEPMSP